MQEIKTTDEAVTKSSDDPAMHLAAMSAFCRSEVTGATAAEFAQVAQEASPMVERWLAGERGEELITSLRDTFPKLRTCLRALAEAMEPVKRTEFMARGKGYDLRKIVHSGAHIKACVYGLFPDSEEALADPPSQERSWADDGLLEHNMHCTSYILRDAANIVSVWQEVSKEIEKRVAGSG